MTDRAAPHSALCLEFNLPVEPTAKGRPRVVRLKNGASHAFSPDRTVDCEERIRWHLRAQNASPWPSGTALHVSVTFFCRRPKSLPTKVLFHTKKPDLDQFVKLVLDACNGILFHDDSQVVSLTAVKRYCLAGEPSITLSVEEAK
jgi:Holliday junction resolvase RusA-like endonuclease